MSKNFWEKNAESWNQAVRSQLVESRKVTNPAIIAEILKKKPKAILDLGCGEGWIASQLIPKGIEYTGLDFSSKLIESARATYPKGVFEVVGYEDLEGWKNPRSYGVVVFNFSLFDEDIRSLLRKASSFLKPEGTLLIQTLSPKAALDPYEDGWRIEDFKTFPVPFEGTMRWYGRTLESWLKTFQESGLQVVETVEPLQPETKRPLSVIFSLSLNPIGK